MIRSDLRDELANLTVHFSGQRFITRTQFTSLIGLCYCQEWKVFLDTSKFRSHHKKMVLFPLDKICVRVTQFLSLVVVIHISSDSQFFDCFFLYTICLNLCFLRNKVKTLPFILIQEKQRQVLGRSPEKLTRYKVDEDDPGTSYIDYSQILTNFMAPASIQFFLSLLMR